MHEKAAMIEIAWSGGRHVTVLLVHTNQSGNVLYKACLKYT